MNHELDNSHPSYIRMTTTGVVDKAGLIAAMAQLMNHPDYASKHSFWDFTRSSMGLSITDLGEIAGVLKLYKVREQNFARKSALVVPSLMELSMARVFVSMAKVLPFQYRVFDDKQKAKDFLTAD